MDTINFKIPVLCLAISFTLVSAHVSLTKKFSEPGKNIETAFHIPHGCSGSPTISVIASIPENINVSTPQEFPGWNVSKNYRDSSNSSISKIIWDGGYLQSTESLDLPIMISVPSVDLSISENYTFYFPVNQLCENSTVNWVDVPDSKLNSENLKNPAPKLMVVKNATEAENESLSIDKSKNDHSNDASRPVIGLLPIVAIISILIMKI